MGRLFYGAGHARVEIEDRALAHLHQVINNKLRRGEAFFFSWKEDVSVGDGRRSIWIHPAADLEIRYHGGRTPALNREWLEALAIVANSAGGLYLVAEPTPRARSGPTDSSDI